MKRKGMVWLVGKKSSGEVEKRGIEILIKNRGLLVAFCSFLLFYIFNLLLCFNIQN